MENTNSGNFTKKVSIAFMEREPQFIKTQNPYVAARFYKDMANSDFSLYTKKDYEKTYSLLASVAFCNGRIVTTSKYGCIIEFVFSFSSKGNFEEFLENIKQINIIE